MSDPRKFAWPVREGYLELRDGDGERDIVVWQDHLWNTGEETRIWLLNPGDVASKTILERVVDIRTDAQYRNHRE